MVNFAVTMVHGPGWNPARKIRDQDAWDDHAAFMDGLVDDGFVILGGPIGDEERADEAEALLRGLIAAGVSASALRHTLLTAVTDHGFREFSPARPRPDRVSRRERGWPPEKCEPRPATLAGEDARR